VRLSRLRGGERTALVGAVALAVLLGFDWFFLSTPDARIGAHESGIRGLGWLAALLAVGAAASGIALTVATVTQRAPAWPVILSVLTTVLGTLATVAIVVRHLAQPGLGVDAGNADVDLEPAAYLGLLAALAVALGGARAMSDERTDAPESIAQAEEVLRARGAPRPAPPPTTARASGPADGHGDPAAD
jgi:hypothetical protein